MTIPHISFRRMENTKPVRREGVCVCGAVLDQFEINPLWLEKASDDVRDMTRRGSQEINERLYMPKLCNACDSGRPL